MLYRRSQWQCCEMITLPRDAPVPPPHWSTASRAEILLVTAPRRVTRTTDWHWPVIAFIVFLHYNKINQRRESSDCFYIIWGSISFLWASSEGRGHPQKWISYEKFVISLTRPDKGPQGEEPPSLSSPARDGVGSSQKTLSPVLQPAGGQSFVIITNHPRVHARPPLYWRCQTR